jgi:thiaminase II
LPEDAEREMLKLLPLTTILTPNVPEACLLNHHAPFPKISAEPLLDLGGMKQLAKGLQMLGPQAVLLKVGYVPLKPNHQNEVQDAGNGDPEVVIDIFYDGHEFTTRETWYSTSANTHGAGCSLASALAANLALKKPLHAAVQDACQYVETAIKTGFQLGHGNGPINHFHSLQVLSFAPGRFLDYLFGRTGVAPLWNDFTQHKFVRKVGDGSLPLDVFKRFLVQDYLYLTQFARTNALAAFKSNNMNDIAASAQIVLGVQNEMRLHLEYCQDLGISQHDLEASKESQATVSYSRYLLDIGQSGDWLGLQVAMASCLVGYQIAAEWVKSEPGSRSEGNRYWKWVENYGGEEYAEGVRVGRGMIEKHACQISPNRVEELVRIFIRVTELEVDFWEFDAHLR